MGPLHPRPVGVCGTSERLKGSRTGDLDEHDTVRCRGDVAVLVLKFDGDEGTITASASSSCRSV
ncbi:hypothetical protein GCM10009841_19640 [Microlunatus panaciterrae]